MQFAIVTTSALSLKEKEKWCATVPVHFGGALSFVMLNAGCKVGLRVSTGAHTPDLARA